LTTEAGRSTTSPAAILLDRVSGSTFILGMICDWCLVFSVWYLVFGVWSLMFGQLILDKQ